MKRINKYIFIFLSILLFVLGPIYYGLFSIGTPSTKKEAEFRVMKNQPFLHEKGKVKMLIFFDFSSLECYEFEKDVVSKLKNKFGNKLEVNFIGYPLSPDFYLPVEAYEIAKALGKGDEMREKLFEAYLNGKDIKNMSIILNISKSIGLDESYTSMLSNTRFERTNYNLAFGQGYNINSLPYVVLDGQIVVTELTEANLERVIEYLLQL
ncbi:MAG: hypothetical protein DRN88_00960 [Candidatus Hydrothermarchaeota archaeon]|nr:MAG: hypothetical protein DRN88_00960 [Candidatus Hydrothermarchaeota archaeon]